MTIWQVATREARRTCAKCPPVPIPLLPLSPPMSSASGKNAGSLKSNLVGRPASTRRRSLESRAASANRRSKRCSSWREDWSARRPSCLPESTEGPRDNASSAGAELTATAAPYRVAPPNRGPSASTPDPPMHRRSSLRRAAQDTRASRQKARPSVPDRKEWQ